MRFRQAGVFVWIGALAALSILPAHAQRALQLRATIGIGGRYRAGGWIPITAHVVNPGPNTVHGQIQISMEDASGTPSGNAIFSCPADIPPGPAPQDFQIETQGIDPGTENVVVRVVSGAARGDGATLAEISTASPKAQSEFTDTPVSPTDLFLVGLSADSTAITRLNGQSWGVEHSVDGPVLALSASPAAPAGMPPAVPGPPATVQTSAAMPADLPSQAAGYTGVDAVLLRGDAPLDALSGMQTTALKAWVVGGGHLIILGGSDPTLYANSFYTGLLPASIGAAPSGTLALTPLSLPGVRVLSTTGGHPTIVTGPYGAGQVTVLAAGSASAAQWIIVLCHSHSSLLATVASRETNSVLYYNGGNEKFSDTAMRAPALAAPAAGVIGLFLAVYVLILVPLNYLILKRFDKKEWSWGTIPALVLLFALVTYGVGYAAKGSSVFVTRAAIVETSAGQHTAGEIAAVGLFSPHRTTYDLTVADPNALAAPPVPIDPRMAAMYNQSPNMVDALGQVNCVETGENVRIQDAAVNMWAMRAFDVETTTDLAGEIQATLTNNPQTHLITGSIINRTPYTWNNCLLHFHGSWQTIGSLAPGASTPVFVTLPTVPLTGISLWSGMPQQWNNSGAQTVPVQQQISAALSLYVSSLGQNTFYSGGGYNGGSGSPAFFQPRSNEAILIGWCDDPKLARLPIQVDGHPVTQNSVTMLVVHIPLR